MYVSVCKNVCVCVCIHMCTSVFVYKIFLVQGCDSFLLNVSMKNLNVLP